MHGISRKQDTAIGALLSRPTISAAAESVGIGESTLRRWLKDRDFLTAYRAVRREAVSQAIGHLQGACSVAVLTLTDISQDVNCPASARVSAARTVLELALKGVELEDLAVRVEELESQVSRA